MKQDFSFYIADVNYIFNEVENLDHGKSGSSRNIPVNCL